MSLQSGSSGARASNATFPIQSTAGAVPVRNEKGEVSMQKVKVNRYIPGKRPDYAPRSSSEEMSEDEEFIVPNRMKKKNEEEDIREPEIEYSEKERDDPRLRRLQELSIKRRHRASSESEGEEEQRPGRYSESDSESEEEDVVNIERRRAILRQKALEKLEEDEVLMKEEEKSSSSEESESEYEEYTDSEEESAPRLKPVFVRKVQRITIKSDPIDDKVKIEEVTKKQEQKRVETLKLVEAEIVRDKTAKGQNEETMANMPQLTDVNTDDEDGEADYEAWKLRELKRIKRDRDERETLERDRREIERLHSMTEEERRLELKLNPKVVVNKAAKGKYKFLQKYYHRGVFYLDKEDDVLKRDYAQPTLEDHFDKSVLPKVMQVKNFGRSGRTKYTHLVDQDTTNFESPWVHETTSNVKFYSSQAGGMRQTFEKPSAKSRKLDMDQGPS